MSKCRGPLRAGDGEGTAMVGQVQHFPCAALLYVGRGPGCISQSANFTSSSTVVLTY
jgi:hypothetical protein